MRLPVHFRNLFLILCIFFFIPSSWSQTEEIKFEEPEEMSFESIPAEQGLSNKSIPAIIEDKLGYIWFATQEGLNKYNGYEFKVYQNDPSDTTTISNNNIFSLIQDKDGYMWLGTENGGINRFDPVTGNSIRFMHDENNPKTICSNNVYSILETKNGYLWIGTLEGGIDVLNRKTGEIISRYKHDPKDGNSVSNGAIWNIYEDPEGLIWISTWGGGLDKLDPKTGAFTHFKHDPNNPSSISSDIVGPIYEDLNGKMWIATWGGGLNRFDRRTETFKSFMFDAKDPKSIGSNLIWPIVEDENGYLLIGTYGSGINKFNPRTETFKRYAHDPKNPSSLNHNDIWSLHIDRSHILWVGTEGGGVSKYVNIKKEVDVYAFDPGNPLSLGHNSVRAIEEDQDGMIWIGTWDGGLDRFDRASGKITNFKNDSEDGNNTGTNKIKAILSDKQGRLWLGTYRGGLAEFDKTKNTFTYYTHVTGDKQTISDDYVYSLAEDQQGNLWVGTLSGLNIFDRTTKHFTRFKNDPSNPKSISNNSINVVFVDNKGTVWLGTDLGLNRFDASTKTFTRFLHDSKDSMSLSHSTVYTIYQDKSGVLWVGTRNGLNQFNPANQGFEHLASSDGLANNTIMAIQEDEEGQLLISTKNGISRFNKKSRTFINYDINDGIAGRQFFPNASCKTKDGKVYFGGTEGMNAFFPERIQNNPYVPAVIISGIKKFGQEMKFDKPISELKELEFAHDENSMTFEFVALSYANSEENQYAYKLEGVDKDWKYGSNIRLAHYSNLHPGTYVFRVKASNDDGLWNLKGASIRIIINPPFWKTMWFYALCVITGILLILGFIKSREKKLIREKKILERKVDLRTAEVMMQKEIVETQNKEIKDSILYAKRIQEAILPSQDEISKAFPDSFVLFKPRDIVSGDFYWFSEKHGKLVIAVADCTGHGVPGAFMSMIGNTLLNEIVNEKEVIEPYHILFQLRENIMKCLKQTGAEGENKDGMDIALCVFDRTNLHLEFAGANNPLYLISEEELLEIKGDKQPIGVYAGETKPFTNHLKVLKKGDCIYIASDGYADQFGGTNGKKFKYKQMKDLLVSSKNMSMQEQKIVLENNIEQWRGDLEQVDDILVIGIRV